MKSNVTAGNYSMAGNKQTNIHFTVLRQELFHIAA